MRHLRFITLAFAAALVSAIALAAAAQANQLMSAGNVTVKIKADQSTTGKLTIDGSSVTCTTAHYETAGEISSPAGSITVHPTYSGCTEFGFINAPITTTGCNFLLTVGALVVGSPNHYEGSAHLECESGKSIVFSSGGVCEARIGAPQLFNGITYTNVSGSVDTVTIGAHITNIAVNKTKDGFGCPFSGVGETTGAYEDTIKVAAEHGGTSTGITIEGTE